MAKIGVLNSCATFPRNSFLFILKVLAVEISLLSCSVNSVIVSIAETVSLLNEFLKLNLISLSEISVNSFNFLSRSSEHRLDCYGPPEKSLTEISLSWVNGFVTSWFKNMAVKITKDKMEIITTKINL